MDLWLDATVNVKRDNTHRKDVAVLCNRHGDNVDDNDNINRFL